MAAARPKRQNMGRAPQRKGTRQMTSNTPLFIIIVGLLGLTSYLLVTAPKITAQEREEMEKDWWS
jgi:hypothetical protein